MTRAATQFDPIALIPAQASQNENIEYNRHSQIVVPAGRAWVVFRVRLGRAVGGLVMFTLAGGACYWLVNGPEWAGWVALSGLCLGICIAWAASAPFASLERYQMSEIAAPGHDSERQAIAEMVLKYWREQQAQPAQAPVLRVEAHVGGGKWRLADMPGPSHSALVWLARDVVAGMPFALTTAKRQHYSRRQFDELRDKFFEAGWAVWANEDAHAQGVLLTDAGMRVMNEAAATSLAEAKRGC